MAGPAAVAGRRLIMASNTGRVNASKILGTSAPPAGTCRSRAGDGFPR